MTTTPSGGFVAATVLYQDKVSKLPRTWVEGDDLWLTLPDLVAASEWEIKPEGVCRGETCVPVPDARHRSFFYAEGGQQWFNLTEFARLIDQPFARDGAHGVWYFGPPGWEWQAHQGTPEAPDFTLPDLQGKQYTLFQFRGKKVVLACWASW
ncbi:MAG: redoxin domain-containing protein [SAR202 cluster bacterium]|nr:redoxin domain-containing protein [SAR202 cluster bacterium]